MKVKQHDGSRKYCYRLWPFFGNDHNYIAQYLEDKEKQGLRLDSIMVFDAIAKYEKVLPQSSQYCTDLFFSKDEEEKEGYLSLCNEAGWECVAQQGPCKVFRQRSMDFAAPLETDDSRKLEKAKRLEKTTILNGLPFLFLTFFWAYKFRAEWDALKLQFFIGTWGNELLATAFLLTIIGFYSYLFQSTGRLWHIRGLLARGQPGARPKAVKRAVLLSASRKTVNICVCGAIVFILWEDQWFDNRSPSAYLWILSIFVLGIVAFIFDKHHCYDSPKGQRWAAASAALKETLPILIILGIVWMGVFTIMGMQEPQQRQNFYLSSIKGDIFFNELSGDAVLEARNERKSDLLWTELNDAMLKLGQRMEARYGNGDPKQRPLEEQETWSREQLKAKGFGEYEEGYYYPLYSRLMMRKENSIRLMEFSEKNSGEEKGE